MSALRNLAIAFGASRGGSGANTTIADLRHARPNPVFISSRGEAVRLIVRANLERGRGIGHGNRAQRRWANATSQAAKLAEFRVLRGQLE